MHGYGPAPGLKGRTFELWVLNRWVFDFWICTTSLHSSGTVWEPITETGSHATHKGTLIQSCLSLLSHCELSLAWETELVHMSQFHLRGVGGGMCRWEFIHLTFPQYPHMQEKATTITGRWDVVWKVKVALLSSSWRSEWGWIFEKLHFELLKFIATKVGRLVQGCQWCMNYMNWVCCC